jgi:hypothetical protein
MMLAATQHNEQVVMNPAYPAQNAEYTHSCDAVTMPTPDSRRPGIEDATTIRGSNQITNDEAVDAVTRHPALKSDA